MRISIRPILVTAAAAVALVAGLVLLRTAADTYDTHVTGVYLDTCGVGQYSRNSGPDYACYPYALDWLYWYAGGGAALVGLGLALLGLQAFARLGTAPGWELGMRALTFLIAVPVLASTAWELLFRSVVQGLWRDGCWTCANGTAVPPTAPDPYPTFDVAMGLLVVAALCSLLMAVAVLAEAGVRLARRDAISGTGRTQPPSDPTGPCR